MTLQQEIFERAKKAGACKNKGLDLIARANGLEDLISLMKSPQGIEFCMENRFPSIETLIPYSKELEANNIYVSGHHNVVNPRLAMVLGGSVNISVDGYNVSEIYVSDGAVNVSAEDNAYVSIELHQGAKLGFQRYGMAKVNTFNK